MGGSSMGSAAPGYSTRDRIIWGMRLSPGPEILYIWGPVLEVPMDSPKAHEGGGREAGYVSRAASSNAAPSKLP